MFWLTKRILLYCGENFGNLITLYNIAILDLKLLLLLLFIFLEVMAFGEKWLNYY